MMKFIEYRSLDGLSKKEPNPHWEFHHMTIRRPLRRTKPVSWQETFEHTPISEPLKTRDYQYIGRTIDTLIYEEVEK